MKNIAILSYSLTAGGAERIAGLLSKYLSKKYKVYLFLYNCNVITYDYEGTIINLSVNGEEKVEETLRESKKKYQIECAISFLIIMNCLNVRTREKEKVILSNRCSYGEVIPYSQGMAKRIKTWYNGADRIVSCSYGAKYDLVHNFDIDGNIITPIYNFIDKKNIIRKAEEPVSKEVYSFKGNSKLIINVGRLDEQKNQCKLLVQFTKLIQEGYDVKLIFVGSGCMEGTLKTMVKDLGITDKVRFETYCKNPFPYYKLADMMACSTDYEGLPNVILEAMVLGIPVVSTDCLSGPLELIKGSLDYTNRTKGVEICERGVLVQQAGSDKTGKTAYLAEGMKKLLDDDSLCQQISFNEQKYMENYDNNKIFDSWIEVIEYTKMRKRILDKPVLQELANAKRVIVYGTGMYGKAAMRYILSQNVSYDLLCFAVTDKTGIQERIYDIPVYQIEEVKEYKEDAIVVIGVSAKLENEIENNVKKYGFHYIFSEV